MQLRPQDIVVALKLVALGSDRPWTFQQLSVELFISASEVHASLRRAAAARLVAPAANGQPQPVAPALAEFLVHGVKYAYPAERGALCRGMPTGAAGPPLAECLAPSTEPPPVWPFAEGKTRGYQLTPLYRTVPRAAGADRHLYELLALVDAIRDGRARERALATEMLEQRLRTPAVP